MPDSTSWSEEGRNGSSIDVPIRYENNDRHRFHSIVRGPPLLYNCYWLCRGLPSQSMRQGYSCLAWRRCRTGTKTT
ncbi:hypothetical protein BJX70DRAFT_341240 [Aspergillus crustosus]